MKKIIFALSFLALLGCEYRVSQRVEANNSGKVTINGKECDVVVVDPGGMNYLWFIDCGPGSSSTSFQQGKTRVTVNEYNPPVSSAAPTCSCPYPKESK